eukprot:TRINITY_DN250_c0_g1_i1.p1 TRINITY_DN250_c0_g1~~TRINITY_DN250_c0_g1_i1.p1  ORF type:complete len:375 (+),score=97.81 TRINITY_DN250_c0_g1_i1:75-1199(+)
MRTLSVTLLMMFMWGLAAAHEESTAAATTTEEDKDENVGLAVALSIGAGLATSIGGAAPFFPFIVKYAHTKILAASLALASGVMLYVSFVEIFVKSNDAITLGLGNGIMKIEGSETEEIGFAYPGDKYANLYTTLAFFVGCIIVELLHKLVHCISPVTDDLDDISVVSKETARIERASQASEQADHENQNSPDADDSGRKTPTNRDLTLEEEDEEMNEIKKKRLNQMGLLTALAIALHNFPEGFATFIATLEEPSLGAGLAVAIAIHNIPEGICIAMPVYYATGSKWKAFGWAFLSGLSEPIGGILGWVALRSVFTDAVFGIIFGVVGGMMVWIVLGELLPTCFSHDPEGKLVKPFLFFGMVIMSASLIAFNFA